MIAAVGSGADVAAQTGDGERLIVPIEFTGTIQCVEVVSGGSADVRPDLTVDRGEIYRAGSEISDERLDGSHTVFFNSDNFKALGSPTSIGSETWVISNDAGTWEGSYHVIGLPVEGSIETTKTTVPLIGHRSAAGEMHGREAEGTSRAYRMRSIASSTSRTSASVKPAEAHSPMTARKAGSRSRSRFVLHSS